MDELDKLKEMLQSKRPESIGIVSEGIETPESDPLANQSAYEQLKDIYFENSDPREDLRQKLLKMAVRQ